jgi:hypothetical protein
LRRRFRGTVPIDPRHDHRVELDNELPKVQTQLPPDILPPITWGARLYLGYAKLYQRFDVDVSTALLLARASVADPDSHLENSTLSHCLLAVVKLASKQVPDGLSLQSEWAGWSRGKFGPLSVLTEVASKVEDDFPAGKWRGSEISPRVTYSILSPRLKAWGDSVQLEQPVPLSLRLLVATVALSLLCLRLNEGEERLNQVRSGLESTRGVKSKRLDALIKTGSRTGRPKSRQTSLLVQT